VGTDIFFAAYIMDGSESSPFIDAHILPPYQTLMLRDPFGGGPFGWYSSYHHVYIRAFVRIYEYYVPFFENLTHYSSTMTPGPYPVEITVICFVDSLLSVDLLVTANGVEDTIPMVPTKEDTTIYAADIPSFTQGTKLVYHVEALDSDSGFSISASDSFWYLVPSGSLLYVDESNDPVLDYCYIFDTLGINGGYDVYDTKIQGQPDSTFLTYLLSYPTLIWNGDWGYQTMLTKPCSTNILYQYFLNGGNVFFGSDEILGLWDGWVDVNYYPGEFPYEVLKVDHVYNDISYSEIFGVNGDTISNGIYANMMFPMPNWGDEVGILDAADSIFTNGVGSTIRGVKWEDGSNKVVFFPFMYTSLPESIQILVMERILLWFGTQMGVTEEKEIQKTPIFILSQNKPNPCSGKTTIRYSLPNTSFVSLDIFNSAGHHIISLVECVEEPGFKSVVWNGFDKNNEKVAQGVYFYRLVSEDQEETKKLILLR
jgi:hypothetical protein